MVSRIIRKRLALCLTAVSVFKASILYSASIELDRLFPTNTIALLTLRSVPELQTSASQLSYGKLWADPAMKAFRDHFESTFQKQIAGSFSNDWGVSLTELADLAAGPVKCALVPGAAGQTNTPTSWIIAIETGPKADRLSNCVDRVRAHIQNAGRMLTNFPPATNRRFSFRPSTNSPPQVAGWGSQASLLQSGSLLLLGGDPVLLLASIQRASDPGLPSLIGNAVFEMDNKTQFQGAQLTAWFNAQAVSKMFSGRLSPAAAAMQSNELLKGSLPSWEKASRILGLTALKSISISFLSDANGLKGRLYLRVPEAERTGLVRLVVPQRRDSSPPYFVPQDAIRFVRYRLDGPRTWTQLESTLTALSPELGSVLQLLTDTLGKDTDADFDFRKHAVSSLGDDFILWQRSPKATTLAEWENKPTFILIGTTNSQRLLAGIKSFASIAPNAGETNALVERKIQEQKVWSYEWPDFEGERPGKAARHLLLTALPSHLAITFDEPLLAEFLQATTNSAQLSKLKGISNAISSAGGDQTGLLTVNNLTASLGPLWNFLRTQPADVASAWTRPMFPSVVLSALGGSSAADWFDLKLLPPFESVARFFSFHAAAGDTDPDGLQFRWTAPNPAANQP